MLGMHFTSSVQSFAGWEMTGGLQRWWSSRSFNRERASRLSLSVILQKSSRKSTLNGCWPACAIEMRDSAAAEPASKEMCILKAKINNY